MHALRLVNTSQVFNRRRSKRCVLDRRTTGQVIQGDRAYLCVIEDVSLGGVRLSFDDAVPDGGELVLEHAVAGSFVGRIVWTKDAAAGFEFAPCDDSLGRELQCIALMVGSDDTQSVRQPVP